LQRIDTGDSRIINAVFRSGGIYYAQTVGLPASGLTHTAAQMDTGEYQCGSSCRAVASRIPPPRRPTSGKWYAYPSITVNSIGDALLGFSQFAFNQFASAGYPARSGLDPLSTMRDPVIFKAGEDYYARFFGGSANRWGDYSMSQVDPADDIGTWTIQEYAMARRGRVPVS